MLETGPQWGFLVGAGAVGVPAVGLVVVTEGRGSGWAWMAALTATLIGGGWASLLSIRDHPATVARAALLGSYAWMAATLVFSLLMTYYALYLLFTLPIAALSGAVMGAAVGGLMKWAGIRVRKTA